LNLYGLKKETDLKKRAIFYLNYFHELFLREKFDFLISSGDSRILPSCLIHIARSYGVKIIYFEQGPFGTTIFDEIGVNAAVSFEPKKNSLTKDEEVKLSDFINHRSNSKQIKYFEVEKKSVLERLNTLLTYFCLYRIPILEKFMPADLLTGQSFASKLHVEFLKKLNINRKNNTSLMSPHNTVSIFLQVPVDAQLIDHSPYLNCFYQMTSEVINNLPNDTEIVIREHPFYRGNYDKRIYSLVKAHANVSLGNDYNLYDLISSSKLCVLINSTIGIEAMLLGKKVFTMGMSYYSHRDSGTYDFSGDFSSLGFELNSAMSEPLNLKKMKIFLYEFIFDYLYFGHFHDKDLKLDPKFFRLLNKD
jgi:capsular polysaccharide export protein